ncbi:glycoside hydrolase family 18 protein [Actinokineospora diospyrosa]|uniref:chitinase n=1 Tax=Actinokineospora diospyrosa TaxID=103728 RepID=A0ABT1IM62_9PSEU|nr:glycoside hydrolase family 18 protein [Actinokineospora diospyrosa]MCP2273603.1 chitinase [Actinokineospora diospyrosa]
MSANRWRAAALLTGVAVAAAVVVAPQAQAHPDHGHGGGHSKDRVIGYFTNWGIYGRNFTVRDLDTSGTAARLTHLNYAFGFLDAQGNCVASDAWADYQKPFEAAQSVDGVADVAGQPLSGNLNQIRKLKKKYPKLRVLISLGGWSGSKYFSNAALTAESRKAHVKSCVDQWIKGNVAPGGAAAGVFDGIDLDWEWPNSTAGDPGNISRPEDKANYTKLMEEYRRQLPKGADLTAYLPANTREITSGFEVSKVLRLLTFGNLQGYDYHGAWDPTTNQQSGLRTAKGDPTPAPGFSTQVVVDAYVSRGAPRDKLVLGVPFFGRGWTGVANVNNGLYQKATGPAPATWEAGSEDYKVLKTKVGVGGYKVYRDEKAGHAWLYDGNNFWTYDDPTEIRRKARYINSQGLGGAMVWSLDADTSDGELIKALHRELSC